MKSDDIDDDQLDAFLRGEDALAQRLQTLAQPGPSAGLDAAILARAQAAHKPQQAHGRPLASNDPAPPEGRPASRRWRIPAGLAAVLLAGVLTQRTWEESAGLERIDAPAPQPPPAAMVREQVVEIDLSRPTASAPVMAPPAVEVAQPPPPAPAAARRAQRAEMHAGLEKPAPQALPAPAPAPAEVAAAPAAAAAAPAVARSPEVWLGQITALLDAGATDAALGEWDAFRAAHPDYPVDRELAAAIAATVSARRTP